MSKAKEEVRARQIEPCGVQPSEGMLSLLIRRYHRAFDALEWELAQPSPLSIAVGAAAENEARNRYSNVLPWDHHRVQLKSERYADNPYVNASPIELPGAEGGLFSGKHLACQGPLPTTIEHFWAAIYERDIGVIVQVTDWQQGGREKCEPYIPLTPLTPFREGPFEVSEHSRRVVASLRGAPRQRITQRGLLLRGPRGDERPIQHVHCEAWPDHGSVDPSLLWALVEGAADLVSAHGPMAVHCSAGVGRTGTFFTACAMKARLDQARGLGLEEIDGIIEALRQQRMMMVQSPAQYVGLWSLMTWLSRGEGAATSR